MKRTSNGRTMTRRWGPFRQEWYSICSMHFEWNDKCDLCNSGTWINVHGHKVSHYIHNNHYKLWYLWANRPWHDTLASLTKIKKNNTTET